MINNLKKSSTNEIFLQTLIKVTSNALSNKNFLRLHLQDKVTGLCLLIANGSELLREKTFKCSFIWVDKISVFLKSASWILIIMILTGWCWTGLMNAFDWSLKKVIYEILFSNHSATYVRLRRRRLKKYLPHSLSNKKFPLTIKVIFP